MNTEYQVRKLGYSDKRYAIFTCPNCSLEATIDKDQFEGSVSIDCPQCSFHETLNLQGGTDET